MRLETQAQPRGYAQRQYAMELTDGSMKTVRRSKKQLLDKREKVSFIVMDSKLQCRVGGKRDVGREW